jgi:hypothetical protein
MNEPRIEVGRRVRKHLPYHDQPQGVIVEIHGELQGIKPRPGPMQLIRPGMATFDVVTFDGRRFNGCREHDVGRLGIGAVDLLDKVHGPALIAKALELHAEREAEDARQRAEAPHRVSMLQASLVLPDQVPLFYWNGLKDAKGAKLQKAYFSAGNYGGFPEGTIAIYARDYARFSALVRACFAVENDSDLMTDYFASDTIRVAPSHPLYPQVKAAHEAQEAYRAKRAAR